MDQQNSSIRMGAAVILCALAFRFLTPEVVQGAAEWLTQPNIAAFLTYLETGRDVRFSASKEVFWEYSPESPPPAVPEPTEPPFVIPTFSAEDVNLVEMYYTTKLRPDLETLMEKPLAWNLVGEEPTVLILHTHSTESYTKSGENYEETSSWRTLDENYNMLSIGARVAQLLAEEGITAVQDRELHDYPSYNGSYVDARGTIEEYLEEYPTIQLVLDLHRDASEGVGGQLRTLANVEGTSSAQLMLVMGTNYDTYEENLSVALKVNAQLEKQSPGITRPLCLRPSRFNQDLCPGALLVEVGAAGNTHAEALRAAEVLADAIIALSQGTMGE